ncbi:GNAT family N-acetyltransferase [Dyella sp. A6]|uniref:GNAT family N-acetyltransferase n=1 Tax=Dyella aluminiiresistens TaxID=3069105 RepID=UPI002E75F5C1|nr:GNAT family N-acetyltransferase [Dyella sp. A6]
MHPLDRPVWSSLTTAHHALSLGNALARRYASDVNLFASACDDSTEALAALAALVDPGQQVYQLQVPAIAIPPALVATKQAWGVQMVATAPLAPAADTSGMVLLGDTDASEMLALARLTQPGPFLAHTHRMGQFTGIRIDGRLAAMAGERFRFPGWTEVSGVCTHPDFRGRGLARRLSQHVAAGIATRGDTAFLHAWRDNTAAIRLYESLGFAWRSDVHVAVLARA